MPEHFLTEAHLPATDLPTPCFMPTLLPPHPGPSPPAEGTPRHLAPCPHVTCPSCPCWFAPPPPTVKQM